MYKTTMRGCALAEGVPMVNDLDEDASGDFKELQDALLSTESVEQFLHEMSILAAGLVRGGLSCGMTLQSSGRPMTVACSDPVAAQVDEVQYKLDDGPCLHAMRDGHTVRIEDTTRMKNTGVKTRWPEFEARAASHGIRSCLALPLTADGRPIGAINLYARKHGALRISPRMLPGR
jgi:GAF domain-containing protein